MTQLENIKAIGDRLRSARESLGRSIEDIALTTRIDRKYLSEIEKGVLPALPPTYIRAFIQDYARVLDLDPVEVMAEGSSQSGSGSAISTEEEDDENVAAQSSFNIISVRKSPANQYRILLLLAVLVVLGLIGTIIWLRQDNTVSEPKEISFSEAVKEREQKLFPASANDSTIAKPASAIDTLFLEAVASESVWVRIAIDGGTSSEQIIPRFAHKRWKAKQLFALSLGNAAGISFTLNGRKLGTLSPIKRQMNNVKFNRETLRKFQQP